MDFEIAPEQQDLVDSVRAVLAQECPTALVRDIVENGSTPEQPWKSARELGWTAIDLPESLGGLALGFTALGLVVEQHGCRIAPGPFLATVTQFLPLVCEAGAPEQLARFAQPAGAGELRGALAIDHGRAAEQAPGESLRAWRDGAAWVLEGQRTYVLDGGSADEIAVAARVDAGDGVGLFAVPQSAVKAQRIVALDASRPLAHLRFDRVRVEPERVLGTPGRSARALGRALERAVVAASLECVGACQTLLEMTVEHAKSRRQFDQPIGAFQAIQHKCADMLVQLEKARATGHFAMMALAEDDPRRALAASMAKAAASDCQRLVCKEAIQIHGGMGYTWESDVQLFVKRAKTLEALFGTGAAHRQRIAALLEI
ncbi:MAG TPA: acyl-CoA dehydrogenase family protein [Myxococcota bacterium]|nr:acyl-CoA dehydrogenase family protein [Myxococcota bacterium]